MNDENSNIHEVEDEVAEIPEGLQGWFTTGGRPCVFTVGELVSNMVDNTSSDLAVCAVENISPSNGKGDYVLTLRVQLVPLSMLIEFIENNGVTMFTQRAIRVLKLKGAKFHEAAN